MDLQRRAHYGICLGVSPAAYRITVGCLAAQNRVYDESNVSLGYSED